MTVELYTFHRFLSIGYAYCAHADPPRTSCSQVLISFLKGDNDRAASSTGSTHPLPYPGRLTNCINGYPGSFRDIMPTVYDGLGGGFSREIVATSGRMIDPTLSVTGHKTVQKPRGRHESNHLSHNHLHQSDIDKTQKWAFETHSPG